VRSKYRWKDNLAIDGPVKEIGWAGVNWIHLAHSRIKSHDLLNKVTGRQIS
jgi:hypothetical protein